ncbi:protein of unknown function (plasmid) [Azospirillum baldaniorum]|uniref:Uncharacterized protein n=1 Tax=Azospirillum baldaniorum TaxID=1064539 RepID=A0A9P1K0K2_9PROT|nr:protein of unknown function [Azospirillum baldaniorum]
MSVGRTEWEKPYARISRNARHLTGCGYPAALSHSARGRQTPVSAPALTTMPI